VSSADLVAQFEATWSDEQLAMHLEAGNCVERIKNEAFELIKSRRTVGERLSDHEIQQFIMRRFDGEGLVTDHAPIVALNEDASNPHFAPSADRPRNIQPGDLVLIDLWAKVNRPEAVFFDITWVGYCGQDIPPLIQKVFEVVRDARVSACSFVAKEIEAGNRIAGFQVDDVARGHIAKHGYASNFVHRTGHSIGTEVHGAGANMDNFESHDERFLIPNTCFSVEPGIYLPEFGIRSEVNVFVESGRAYVTGEQQEQIVRL
jgi:Xaa-Pro aminopeptidase